MAEFAPECKGRHVAVQQKPALDTLICGEFVVMPDGNARAHEQSVNYNSHFI